MGYVKNIVDQGGKTYRGISRVHHPSWSGWAKIDALKKRAGFPGSLKYERSLQASVKIFYKKRYWDKFLGDDISDQQVAMELYDTGVNMGVRRAVRFLQNALNVFNRNQKNYNDLIVDGWLGHQTLKVPSKHLQQDGNTTTLLKLMNVQQGARYVAIMVNDSTQERYARGRLKRA